MSPSLISSRSTIGRPLAVCLALPFLWACAGGGEQSDSAAAETAAAAETTSPGTVAPGSTAESANRPLSPSDIDAFERGLRAELEAVNKAIADKAAAKTGNDTLSAMMSAMDQQTAEAGARAAGVSLDRYREIVSTISSALGAQQMQGMMAKMPTPDTTNLTAEQKARVREGAEQAKTAFGDPYKNLPSDVAEALKPRAAALDSLRMLLVGTRLKAAQ